MKIDKSGSNKSSKSGDSSNFYSTSYNEKLSPSQLSMKQIVSVITDLEYLNNSSNANLLFSLKHNIERRGLIERSDRYNRVLSFVSDDNTLDNNFLKENMQFILQHPDITEALYENNNLPIGILVLYQKSIVWSDFFLIMKDRLTEDYVYRLVQSIHMDEIKWGMIIEILDFSEEFIERVTCFVPVAYLLMKNLSYQFWERNIHRLYSFNILKRRVWHSKEDEAKQKKEVAIWNKFIKKYKNFITPSLLDDSKGYIQTSSWFTVSAHIDLPDEYMMKFKKLIDINYILKNKSLSEDVIFECKDVIDWSSFNYSMVSDKLIISMKGYVDWSLVLDYWSSDIEKPKTEEDRILFEKTGDIIKHKNFVDWYKKLGKWGISPNKHVGFDRADVFHIRNRQHLY